MLTPAGSVGFIRGHLPLPEDRGQVGSRGPGQGCPQVSWLAVSLPVPTRCLHPPQTHTHSSRRCPGPVCLPWRSRAPCSSRSASGRHLGQQGADTPPLTGPLLPLHHPSWGLYSRGGRVTRFQLCVARMVRGLSAGPPLGGCGVCLGCLGGGQAQVLSPPGLPPLCPAAEPEPGCRPTVCWGMWLWARAPHVPPQVSSQERRAPVAGLPGIPGAPPASRALVAPRGTWR